MVDVTDFHERKMEAIRAYRSQFHHHEMQRYGQDETLISQPEFLENIALRAKRYGSSIGVAYGEAFRQHLGHPYPGENLLERLLAERSE